MQNTLSENTKFAAYILWEATQSSNALNLWYCCEGIAFYFESNNILSTEDLNKIIYRSKYDPVYIDFVRNIAYRIYQSTGTNSSLQNWYCTEKLLENEQWLKALLVMAQEFRKVRERKTDAVIRSEWIKRRL